MDKQGNIVSQPCFPKGSKPQNVVSATKISHSNLTKISHKGVSLLGNTPSSLEAKFRPATSVDTFEQMLWLQSFGVFQFNCSELGRSVAPVS
jgi:hypothetical protein